MYPQRPTFASVLRSFGTADGMPFADVLTEQDIQKACADENVFFGDGDGDISTPAITLWAFLTQCLSASKSCLAAVARVMVLPWLWVCRPAPPAPALLQGPRQASRDAAATTHRAARHRRRG